MSLMSCQCQGGLCSHQGIQTTGGSTILWLQHWEHRSSLVITAGEQMHGYLTPALVCFSLSHVFSRFFLLVTKYKVDFSHHMQNTLISPRNPQKTSVSSFETTQAHSVIALNSSPQISKGATAVNTSGMNVVCLGLESLQ